MRVVALALLVVALAGCLPVRSCPRVASGMDASRFTPAKACGAPRGATTAIMRWIFR